ncbi:MULTISPECIES: tetratricopeptide repeat protein [unclassified Microcoleus]|uniref:tetratricopeptide repeat protein n=1 Tax=unclassified Microcoleus TaxID=2642155 RepID=UPI002FD15BF3
MTSEKLEIVETEYQAGRVAFESGRYGQAIQSLETATGLVDRTSRLGGEVQMWLVTAYEASGDTARAIELCRKLTRHPRQETRQQAKRLLFILEAPKLSIPDEWTVKIPDLAALDDNKSINFQANPNADIKYAKPKPALPEPVDLTQVNTKGNLFVWVALMAIFLTLAGLAWLS